jgi:hemoglobin
MSLYERLGGREGIRAVVDDFYDRLVADDQLGHYFEGAEMETLRRTQTDFLCEAAGGPERYEGAPIREAHLHLDFTPGDMEQAIELLDESLEEHDVPRDDADAVLQAIAVHVEDLLARPEE